MNIRRRPLIVSGASLFALSRASRAAASGAGTSARTRLDPSLRVHPHLQYGAQTEPGKRVRVIVQKTSRAAGSGEIARAARAQLKEEFPFIKALLLELPQQAVIALARNPNVRYISPESRVRPHAVAEANLKTTYTRTIRAGSVWNSPTQPATGRGVTVAIVDTGVNATHPDLLHAGINLVVVNPLANGALDGHGHGTHVAGIIAGRDLLGRYIGVAPDAKLISVKVADDRGGATTADLLRGLQWIFDNRTTSDIRVVNVSFGSVTAESYATSPIAAAVEQLWLNGVTVVTSAGNRGAVATASWHAPGNDPFVITVGALDDRLTAAPGDNSLCSFSSRGPSQDRHHKPDVVAPGRRIVSTLASPLCALALRLPGRLTNLNYIRLTGTSMAAPVVTGAIALLLERYPKLTPDQIKWLITTTAVDYPARPDGARALDVLAAMKSAGGPLGAANEGVSPSSALDPTTRTVAWSDAYWEEAYWEEAYWEEAYWEEMSALD